MIKKTTSILAIAVLLSGCAAYGGKFSCSPGEGLGCESVSTVNELLYDNELDDFILAKNTKSKAKKVEKKSDNWQEIEVDILTNGKPDKIIMLRKKMAKRTLIESVKIKCYETYHNGKYLPEYTTVIDLKT